MYATTLLVHSWVRWLVVVLGVWALLSALTARGGAGARKAGQFFTIALDVQFLLGVLLYVVLSPITRAAIGDMAAAMHNGVWRFWSVEHPALMILAVVFGHVGRMAARRSPASRRPVVWYALSIAAILAAIPWPALPYGRPLVRF